MRINTIHYRKELLKLRLENEVKKILYENPHSLNHIKKFKSKNHELVKSLKMKVLNELQAENIEFNQKTVEKIIDKEIINMVSNPYSRLFKQTILLGFFLVLFIFGKLILLPIVK